MAQDLKKPIRSNIARVGAAIALGAILLASKPSAVALADPARLDTLADVRQALRRCWQWPPDKEASAGMDLAVRLTFKRNGEIYGVRVSFHSPEASEEAREPYSNAVREALERCSPLPVSEKLGEAIAGHVMIMHIHDKRAF